MFSSHLRKAKWEQGSDLLGTIVRLQQGWRFRKRMGYGVVIKSLKLSIQTDNGKRQDTTEGVIIS
ncbi:hypothetical protein ACSBR2_023385 [Camellia fascicularis]